MTCIIGYVDKNVGYIAGDFQASTADYHLDRKDGKVFEKGGMLFGFTSSYRMGQLVRYKLEVPQPSGKGSDYEYMIKDFIPALIKCYADNSWARKETQGEAVGGSFIVIRNAKLFQVEPDFQVSQPNYNFWTTGSGQPIAYGAMKAFSNDKRMTIEQKLRKSIEIVSTYNNFVGKRCQIIKKKFNL